MSENIYQRKTYLCSGFAPGNSPICAGFLGGKIRDLPPYGVLGGKNLGFFRNWFRVSILASRSRSISLCGIHKWFIQFLFFGGLAFFKTYKIIVNDRQRDSMC
jgi:hypothetical protein